MRIENVRLESVENGYKINYCEISKKNKGEYDNVSHDYKELVFQEEDSEEAFNKFKELSARAKKKPEGIMEVKVEVEKEEEEY